MQESKKALDDPRLIRQPRGLTPGGQAGRGFCVLELGEIVEFSFKPSNRVCGNEAESVEHV